MHVMIFNKKVTGRPGQFKGNKVFYALLAVGLMHLLVIWKFVMKEATI